MTNLSRSETSEREALRSELIVQQQERIKLLEAAIEDVLRAWERGPLTDLMFGPIRRLGEALNG